MTTTLNPPRSSERRPLRWLGRSADLITAGGRQRTYSTVSFGIVIALFAVMAIHRRWIADDALIAVRTVREILAGHGPVYNPFERAETNTSAAWTWALALLAFVIPADPGRIAVWSGLTFAVTGYGFALFTTRTFVERLAPGKVHLVVPVGFLVILAVPPFWDFASSGLETGLCTLWIAGCWRALVMLTEDSGSRRVVATAVLFGSGPLFRPDFAIASAVFLVALWLVIRPSRRRTLALSAASLALPVLYEVFRAGYYGTLVPLPGLTKSAGSSAWVRGMQYFDDFFGGYLVWIPLTVLAVAFTGYLSRSALVSRHRVQIAAPMVAGLLMGLYVVRVGGDFMRGRMWLPATFLILLPLLALPLERRLLAPIVLVTAWSLLCVVVTHHQPIPVGNSQAEDERAGYQGFTGHHNPTSAADYRDAQIQIIEDLTASQAPGTRMLLSEGGGVHVPLDPSLPFGQAVMAGRLGSTAAMTPLDDFVVDTLGLSNPVGARITVDNAIDSPGHEKVLPNAWILAAYGDPALVDNEQFFDDTTPAQVRAARHAMQCGDLKKVLDAAQKPMSLSRFWNNLVGSYSSSTLVVPADPFEAERKFCGAS
jgi:arabinofuranosyltransferase